MTWNQKKCVSHVLSEGNKLQYVEHVLVMVTTPQHSLVNGLNIDVLHDYRHKFFLTTGRENIIDRLMVPSHRSSNQTFIKQAVCLVYQHLHDSPLVF